MSLTIVVPAAVPSLLHSSRPLVEFVAEKYTRPLSAARLCGVEPAEPGAMSLTIAVPPPPLVDHSSLPFTPSLAVKNSRSPTARKFASAAAVPPPAIVAIRPRPPVLLQRHSRPPPVEKYNDWPTRVRFATG